MVKTRVGYPDHAAEVRVLAADHTGSSLGVVPQASSPQEVASLVQTARSVHVAPLIFDYIASLLGHTRQMSQLRLGASPRDALGLLRASRVRAALAGRPFVVPSDVQAFAEPVLGHRMLVTPAFEASGGTSSDAVTEAVAAVPARRVTASDDLARRRPARRRGGSGPVGMAVRVA